MYKVLRSDRDAYITNRVIKGTRTLSGNVGSAGTLDLYKLYGITLSGSTPNTELSRLLVHFDLQPLRDLVGSGDVDLSNNSFSCTLKLFDVYGGQPTPNNFTAAVFPLSRSFVEGLGRDVVYYSDNDVCNFLSGSRAQGAWLAQGCAFGGGLPGLVDYVTASTSINSGTSLAVTQSFVTGEENLEVDVTLIVSATLAGLLPDEGFRISFNDSIENDVRTYFVKRFASRTAYDESKRPKLIIRYDDSIQDDNQQLFFDSSGSVFFYNYVHGALANLTSGSSLVQITGSNSITLKLETEVSGGWYTSTFTGSQHRNGVNYVQGTYSASVYLSSTNPVFASKLLQSSSVTFVPIWGSLDGTVSFMTGTAITVQPPQRGHTQLNSQRFTVTAHCLSDCYDSNEKTVVRVHIFDALSPKIKVSRLPIESAGLVIRDVHYQVRNNITDVIEIPFDTQKNSTRLSSDASGMFFTLDVSNLTPNMTYVIDIMTSIGANKHIYKAASPSFRVNDVR